MCVCVCLVTSFLSHDLGLRLTTRAELYLEPGPEPLKDNLQDLALHIGIGVNHDLVVLLRVAEVAVQLRVVLNLLPDPGNLREDLCLVHLRTGFLDLGVLLLHEDVVLRGKTLLLGIAVLIEALLALRLLCLFGLGSSLGFLGLLLVLLLELLVVLINILEGIDLLRHVLDVELEGSVDRGHSSS